MSDTPQVIGKPIPEYMKTQVQKPSFMQFVKRPQKKAKLITIAGDGGLGKTTLASLFPNPIIIPIEDGTGSLEGKDVAIYPRINTYNDVVEALEQLNQDGHPFKTVILDSISKLSAMREAEIISESKAKSMAEAYGGFGKGYGQLANDHRKIRELAGRLIDRGIHVIFISHIEIKRISPPDAPEFTKYLLKMHENSTAPYTDDVDCVAFLKLDTIVNGKTNNKTGELEKGKAMTTGGRTLVCYPSPAHVSKNRFVPPIEGDIEYIQNINPFERYL